MVRIVFDPIKCRSNIEKHGFDFADLTLAFFEEARIYPAKESRFIAVGQWGERLLVAVIFLPLGAEAISVVSMRVASRKERERYEWEI